MLFLISEFCILQYVNQKEFAQIISNVKDGVKKSDFVWQDFCKVSTNALSDRTEKQNDQKSLPTKDQPTFLAAESTSTEELSLKLPEIDDEIDASDESMDFLVCKHKPSTFRKSRRFQRSPVIVQRSLSVSSLTSSRPETYRKHSARISERLPLKGVSVKSQAQQKTIVNAPAAGRKVSSRMSCRNEMGDSVDRSILTKITTLQQRILGTVDLIL